jgi:hypothetical protein
MIERADFERQQRQQRIAAMRRNCWSPLPRQRPTGKLSPPSRISAEVRFRVALQAQDAALRAALQAEPAVRERRIDANHVVLERTDQPQGSS